MILNAVKTGEKCGRTKYTSKQAVVVLNKKGKVITTFAKGSKYIRKGKIRLFKLNKEMQILLKQTLESQNKHLLWLNVYEDLSMIETEKINKLRDIIVDELMEKGFDERDNINGLGRALEELIDILGNLIP